MHMSCLNRIKLGSPFASHSHSTTPPTWGRVVFKKCVIQSEDGIVKNADGTTICVALIAVLCCVRLERAIGYCHCAVSLCIDSACKNSRKRHRS